MSYTLIRLMIIIASEVMLCYCLFLNQAVSSGDVDMKKDEVFQLIQAHQVFFQLSIQSVTSEPQSSSNVYNICLRFHLCVYFLGRLLCCVLMYWGCYDRKKLLDFHRLNKFELSLIVAYAGCSLHSLRFLFL